MGSINDHKALSYLLDEGSRQGKIIVAARDRLRRWAAYLRTHNFVTIHIPGVENCFCDLLSRRGCDQVVKQWRPDLTYIRSDNDGTQMTCEMKNTTMGVSDVESTTGSSSTTPTKHQPTSIPQLAIIRPQETTDTAIQPSHKDLDVTGDDLLPQMLGKKWPSAAEIKASQQRHNVNTDHMTVVMGEHLFTDDKSAVSTSRGLHNNTGYSPVSSGRPIP